MTSRSSAFREEVLLFFDNNGVPFEDFLDASLVVDALDSFFVIRRRGLMWWSVWIMEEAETGAE